MKALTTGLKQAFMRFWDAASAAFIPRQTDRQTIVIFSMSNSCFTKYKGEKSLEGRIRMGCKNIYTYIYILGQLKADPVSPLCKQTTQLLQTS